MCPCLGSNSNTTVNIEGVARNVACGRIQGKESSHTSNLFGLAETLQGDDLRNLGKVGFIEYGGHLLQLRKKYDGKAVNE